MADDDVKALVFDVFGTVVDWRTSIAREAEECLSPKGYKLDWLSFADKWRGKYQPAMEKVRSGGRGFEEMTEAELDFLNKAWHRLDPWPDSVAGLLRLKKKFIIGTMSNGNVALMVNMAKNGKLPWDVILGAEPAQTYKPEAKTYLTGVDWLNLQPSEVLMCAAHNSDLLAAGAEGLKTAFIARPTEYGPNQQHDFKAEHDFDYITENMLDLADKLGC